MASPICLAFSGSSATHSTGCSKRTMTCPFSSPTAILVGNFIVYRYGRFPVATSLDTNRSAMAVPYLEIRTISKALPLHLWDSCSNDTQSFGRYRLSVPRLPYVHRNAYVSTTRQLCRCREGYSRLGLLRVVSSSENLNRPFDL